MKKIIALIVAVVMAAALAACGSSGGETTTAAPETTAAEETTTAEAASEEETTEEETTEEETAEYKGTVKIGHLLDLTGVESISGKLVQKCFNFACEQLTKETGWEFEVIEGDCMSDSDKAATAAENMRSQGCIAIFGPTQIGHKKAVLAYAADNPIPVVLYNGSPAAFTGGYLFGNDMIVAMGGGTAGFPTVMADYLYNEVGLRTVYCFKQETVGGNNYVDPFVTCFEAMGGKVVDNIAVAQGTNDWSAYLNAMINSDAEAIVGWTSSSDTIAFYKEWYNSGAYETLPIYATMHGGFSDSFILDEVDPKIADAIIEHGTCAPICYSYTIDTPENNAFVEKWVNEFGEVPLGNNFPGATYQALKCLCEALDAVGPDASPEELANAMRAADFTGPEGHTLFEDGGVTATKDVYVVQVVRLEDGSINYEVKKTYEQIKPNGYNFDGTNYTGN